MATEYFTKVIIIFNQIQINPTTVNTYIPNVISTSLFYSFDPLILISMYKHVFKYTTDIGSNNYN